MLSILGFLVFEKKNNVSDYVLVLYFGQVFVPPCTELPCKLLSILDFLVLEKTNNISYAPRYAF